MFKKGELLKEGGAIRKSAMKKSQIKGFLASFANQISSENQNTNTETPAEKVSIKELSIATLERDLNLYFLPNGNPVFIQAEKLIIPTLYMLWDHQDFNLPTIPVNIHVLERIYNGADLMVPGIAKIGNDRILASAEFEKHSLVALSLYGPDVSVPLVVGEALYSSAEIASLEAGKAVRTIHFYNDFLFKLGDQRPIPKAQVTNLEKELEKIEIDNQADNVDNQTVSETPMSASEMDGLIEQAFTQSLVSFEHQFPLSSSQLFSKMLNIDKRLDLKSSSFKKATKLLKVMAKKGLVDVKERQGDVLIFKVNSNHPTFSSVSLVETTTPSKATKKSESVSSISVSLTVDEGYRVPKGQQGAALRSLMAGLSSPSQDPMYLYSKKEIKTIMVEYAKSMNLLQPQSNVVFLDAILLDVISKRAKKACIDLGEGQLDRNSLLDLLVDSFEVFHILSTDPSNIRRGRLVPIAMQIKKRMGNKKVVIISNLESFDLDFEKVAATLRNKCACSTTIQDSVNGAGKMDIVVQGSDIKGICVCLEKDFGMPPMKWNGKGEKSLVPNDFFVLL